MKILAALPNFRLYCPDSVRLIEENGYELETNEEGRPLGFDELKNMVADVDGVIAGVDVWDAKLLALAPKLKAIARFGVGVDNLDLDACKERGIVVSNCVGINTNSVAEHAMLLILSVLGHICVGNNTTRQGEWRRLMHHELRGQTVGLLGFGAIGRRLAELLQPFGVKIIAYDKFPNEEAAKRLNVTMMSQEDVMAQADILSLHTPSTPETYHMINRDSLATMKDGAILINTSRGPVVDEAVAAEALKSGKLAGYAADVFEHEPPTKDNPLFQYENYICTPHLAGESLESWAQTGLRTSQDLMNVLEGKEPVHRLV